MVQSPFTLFKPSFHPYPRRFSSMTQAAHPVLTNLSLGTANCIRQYTRIGCLRQDVWNNDCLKLTLRVLRYQFWLFCHVLFIRSAVFDIIHANGNDEIMAGAMTKDRIQSDILEWHVPEEVLAVLLKDRSTGRNLIWVTDDYAARGRGFGANGSAIRQLPTAEIDSNGIRHLPSDEIRPSVMFEFYQDAVIAFQNVHTLCKQSSWPHCSTLIKVGNEDDGRLGGRFTAGFLYNIVERA